MRELRAKGLEKAYNGRRVLHGLSFAAGPGVTFVLGPSGAGKTTLLRLLLGLGWLACAAVWMAHTGRFAEKSRESPLKR